MTIYHTYWTLVNTDGGELLAIMKSETDDANPRLYRNEDEETEAIEKELGSRWTYGERENGITKAEFETYQVFSIKEIKL